MFRWGIMGAGYISSQFAKAIASAENMVVQAVASVSGKNPFGIKAEQYYESYEALAEASDIDAVYIGTIHPLHLSCARLCLEAGKPVLCEKPVTMNSAELAELIALAQAKQVFFMEAMWSRYLPAVRYVRQLLAEATCGNPQYMHITFGNCVPESNGRIHQAALGGGALLDVGVYGINLADYWLSGCNESRGQGKENTAFAGFHLNPDKIRSHAVLNRESVDLTTGVWMMYDNGKGQSVVLDTSCSVQRNMPNRAVIVTDQAELVVPYFWRPDKVLGYRLSHSFQANPCILEKCFPIEGNGYQYEALEAKRCIEAGLKESPDMTWEDSLRIMRQLDVIRSQCGICYPQDSR